MENNKRYKLVHGECLEKMKEIKTNSIDLILCDLPYGQTDCAWDTIIPIEPLWKEYKRILKKNGIVVLFGSEPFSSELRMGNKEWYKYDIIWYKKHPGNPLLAPVQPLRVHENISVFYNTKNIRNSYEENTVLDYLQKELEKCNLTIKEFNKLFNTTMGKHYFVKNQFYIPTEEMYKKMREKTGYFNMEYKELKKEFEKVKEKNKNKNKRAYNMQGLVPCNRISKLNENKIIKQNKDKIGKIHVKKYTNYPKSIVSFEKDYDKVHPTQKPVKLLEYLIKTYSNENDIVLDNTMGSGSTGVACMNTGRRFYGIELEEEYFEIAKRRVKEAEENREKIEK